MGKSKSNCAVVSGKVDLGRYEKLAGPWQELGLAKPAQRGLIDQGILQLTDLTKLTKPEFLAIHGIGPTAAKQIGNAMKAKKLKFKSG